MARIPGIDWKSNNLVAIGAVVLVGIAGLFTAIRSIPYADRDQTTAELNDVRNQIKTQWQHESEYEEKNQRVHEQMKTDSADADAAQAAKLQALEDKYEHLLSDESELRGEVEGPQKKNLK